MWIAVLVVIGLLAIGILLALFLIDRNSGAEEHHREMTGDDLFMLGVVFAGAGVALSVSIGPSMIGLFALGIIYMAWGAKKKREESHHD